MLLLSKLFSVKLEAKKGIRKRDETLEKNITNRLIVPFLPQTRPDRVQSLQLFLFCVMKGKL